MTSYRSIARRMVAPQPTDVQQRHAGLEPQFAQRQVDLGDLCSFQRHVVALEVRATVCTRRIQEQGEEVVAQVVMRLDVLEMGRQVTADKAISAS